MNGSTTTRLSSRRTIISPGSGSAAEPLTLHIRDGVIASVSPLDGGTDDDLVLPALVNARAPRRASPGPRQDVAPVDPYVHAAILIAQQALAGCGTVVAEIPRLAADETLRVVQARCRAARDIGVRLITAVPVGDPQSGGSVAMLSLLEKAASLCGASFEIAVPDPGLCPPSLLQSASRLAGECGGRLSIRVADGGTSLAALDRLGVVSDRLSVILGRALDEHEVSLLAERGAVVLVTPVASQRQEGIVPSVTSVLDAGVPLAFGFPDAGLDDDHDVLRDARLARLLYMHGQSDRALETSEFFAAIHRAGFHAATSQKGYGRIEAGAPADLLVLDWSALGPDVLDGTVSEEDVFLTRASARQVRRLMVGGADVVREGRLLNIDLPALQKTLRAQRPVVTAG